MKIVAMHVDERLVHTRFLREWCYALRPKQLLVIENIFAGDSFMAAMYSSLVPMWMEVTVLDVNQAAEYLTNSPESTEEVLVLAKAPVVYVELLKKGVPISRITLADKKYFPNKIKIPAEQRKAILQLIRRGVTVLAQETPDTDGFPIKIDSF